MESLARGGTRWKRFAVVMVPSVAATAAIGVALSQGALAASFSVSGQQFKVTADRSTPPASFSTARSTPKGAATSPVTVVGIDNAKITNLCQSVVVPVAGLRRRLDEARPAGAGEHAGRGEEPLHRPRPAGRGRDVQQHRHRRLREADHQGPRACTRATRPTRAPSPSRPTRATLTDVKQRAWATTAGTFKLSGLQMCVRRASTSATDALNVRARARAVRRVLPFPAPVRPRTERTQLRTTVCQSRGAVRHERRHATTADETIGRKRDSFREWRGHRPFWGGLLTLLAGFPIMYIPYANLTLGSADRPHGDDGRRRLADHRRTAGRARSDHVVPARTPACSRVSRRSCSPWSPWSSRTSGPS